MEQRLMWGKYRRWSGPRKRKPRKLELSERGIYEPVELEKDVVKTIITLLWYSGIPVFREREPRPCPDCKKFAGPPADAGHPDLHGWVPAHKIPGASLARPFYIEVKRPKGGVESEAQKEFIKRANRDGVMAFFARSWSEVRAAFTPLGVILPEAR